MSDIAHATIENPRMEVEFHIASGTYTKPRKGKDNPKKLIIQTEPKLEFDLDYPFKGSDGKMVDFEFIFKNGPLDHPGQPWTMHDLMIAVSCAYLHVYKSLNNVKITRPGETERITYDHFGHGIEDLYVEFIQRNPNGKWDLTIGS